MTKTTIATALGIAVLLGAALFWNMGAGGRSSGVLPYDNDNAVTRGATVYAENCASCHGDDLEGEPNWRERDAEGYLPAPPHDASGHTWHHPDAQLIAITVLGTEAIVGGDYKSRMIGYGEILADDDILNVLAYIKSTWPAEIIDRHNQINAEAADQKG